MNNHDELKRPAIAIYSAIRVVLDPRMIEEEGELLKAMAKAQETSVSTFTRRLYREALLTWEDCPDSLKQFKKTAFGDLGNSARPKKLWKSKKKTRKEKK